ncbi:MAG: hypothetical protein Tsb0010_02790 [Parvularculaceae bacterium]
MADVFREVDEDLRQERHIALLRKYGPYALIAAGVVVLIVAGNQFWSQRERAQAHAAAERFSAAANLAETDRAAAVAALEDIADDGGEAAAIARLAEAGLLATGGDIAASVESYRAVISDPNSPPSIRNLARIRAGYAMVDSYSTDQIREVLGGLELSGSAMSVFASEILALSALRSGDLETAKLTAEAILNDPDAGPQIKVRAQEILGHADARMAAAAAGADRIAAPVDLLVDDDPAAEDGSAAPSPDPAESPEAPESGAAAASPDAESETAAAAPEDAEPPR